MNTKEEYLNYVSKTTLISLGATQAMVKYHFSYDEIDTATKFSTFVRNEFGLVKNPKTQRHALPVDENGGIVVRLSMEQAKKLAQTNSMDEICNPTRNTKVINANNRDNGANLVSNNNNITQTQNTASDINTNNNNNNNNNKNLKENDLVLQKKLLDTVLEIGSFALEKIQKENISLSSAISNVIKSKISYEEVYSLIKNSDSVWLGEELSKKDKNGVTALHIILLFSGSSKTRKGKLGCAIIKLVLEKKVDPDTLKQLLNTSIESGDLKGLTAIQIAKASLADNRAILAQLEQISSDVKLSASAYRVSSPVFTTASNVANIQTNLDQKDLISFDI